MRKTVKKFLRPVQRSVFEGFLSEGKLKQLKAEIETLVNCEEDSVRIYRFLNLQEAKVEQLGVLEDASGLIL